MTFGSRPLPASKNEVATEKKRTFDPNPLLAFIFYSDLTEQSTMTHTIKRHTAHTDSPYSGAPLVFIGKEYTGVIRGAPGTNQPMCGSFVVVSLFSSSSNRASWRKAVEVRCPILCLSLLQRAPHRQCGPHKQRRNMQWFCGCVQKIARFVLEGI